MNEELKKQSSASETVAGLLAELPGAEPEARLRTLGIYTQRPVKDGFFMVRIRIPGGDLTPGQIDTIASLANDYGRGLADITVRQNIQLHWVRLSSLPLIIEGLQAVGLSTIEGAGGGVRNIVNCPVSGADENELYDTTGLVNQVNDFFAVSPEFSDLSRKLKITISGCALRCTYPEIHDIALFAERDRKQNRVGFRARIGGGLSISPRFSRDLGILADPDQVARVCAAIALVFRDRENGKGSERGAKFQVEESEIPAFLAGVETRLGYRLDRAPEPMARPITERDRSHIGIHGQQTNGLYYIGISIMAGRTSGDELATLASLAAQYGSGRIRTTNTQNLALLDIPEWNLEALTHRLDSAGLQYDPSWSRKAIIACSGIEFCKQAVAETKGRAAELSAHLESQIKLDQPVRISVTGCPNSCGQHQICDVGLEGSSVTINGAKEESFQVLLGGGVGINESFARRLGIRIPAEALAESVTSLFTAYKDLRENAETFQEFCARHSEERLIAFMSGLGFSDGQQTASQLGPVTTEQLRTNPTVEP